METTPYINFRGDCAAAFKLYEKCLGGKIVAMFPWRDAPEAHEVPKDWNDKIMHARFEAPGAALMGCDAPPSMYEEPKGISVSVSVPEHDAPRVFNTLAEGGQVRVPLAKTFFAAQFGMLVDRFGVPWMVVSDEQKA
jgi:PhnB protein